MLEDRRYFTLIHRLIHWGIALTMLFILLTVLLRMGWMEKYGMADVLTTSPQMAAYDISQEDAVKAAKTIRGNMFQWHLYAGYLMGVLLLARLAYTTSQGIFYKGPFNPQASVREKFQAWVYIVFYTGVALSVMTGLYIKFGPDDALGDIAKDMHVLALWYLVPFLILHLGGIVLGENGKEKGIASKMIGG